MYIHDKGCIVGLWCFQEEKNVIFFTALSRIWTRTDCVFTVLTVRDLPPSTHTVGRARTEIGTRDGRSVETGTLTIRPFNQSNTVYCTLVPNGALTQNVKNVSEGELVLPQLRMRGGTLHHQLILIRGRQDQLPVPAVHQDQLMASTGQDHLGQALPTPVIQRLHNLHRTFCIVYIPSDVGVRPKNIYPPRPDSTPTSPVVLSWDASPNLSPPAQLAVSYTADRAKKGVSI